MSPTTLTAQLKASTQGDRAPAQRISDAAKAKAAEESRAIKMGNQVLVVAPQKWREVHKNRIGMVMSTPVAGNKYCSVKFSDGSLVSFFAKEIELCPSPPALSYEKINFTNKCIKIPRTLSRARRPPLR